MLTIFNRKELITIVSMQKLFHVKEALSGAGITSVTKTKGMVGYALGNRRHGVPFINQDATYTYTIDVHKDDYNRALSAIQPALTR